MNYIELHNRFIKYFKEVDVRDRLWGRNVYDPRLKEANIYIELHHILPRNEGGTDDEHNLVELLPEEHIFIHFLRWKAFKNKNDILAVNFMLNGYERKTHISDITLNKINRTNYSMQRRNFSKVIRIMNKGNKNIGKRLKNKMFAINSKTGERVGLVSLDHKNVKNGTWVHQNTGRKKSKEELERLSKKMSGKNNFRFSGISNENYIKQAAEFVNKNGGEFSPTKYREYCEKNNLIFLKSFSPYRFGGKWSNFKKELKEYCEELGIKLNDNERNKWV